MNSCYTVTQVNNIVKVEVESSMPSSICVLGEVTSFRPHHTGHCYFALKDNASQLPSVMWKSAAGKLDFKLENGLSVVATGHVEVYVPYGKYQFVVTSLRPAGVGSLQLQFEQMVRKLEAEGLFEQSRKKPLPKYPFNIAVLTSSTGAAVKDISDSIHSRFPCAKIFLYPIPVQGKGAELKIAEAIKKVNEMRERHSLDLIILGRGGGSLEDLWCFNEEITARAIVASKLPIICAVGHEVDTTISDLVADARASTPTKAGVIAVPDLQELLERFQNAEIRLKGDLKKRLEIAKHQLETICASSVFRSPDYVVNHKTQELDELLMRMNQASLSYIARRREELSRLQQRLANNSPKVLASNSQLLLERLKGRLDNILSSKISQSKMNIEVLENKLSAMDPRSVLKRGYSMTSVADTGKLITDPLQIDKGTRIKTEFAQNRTVESIVD